jgi:predicted exporter
VRGPAPEPITLADLQDSKLAPLIRPLIFPVGKRVASLTYLRELRDESKLKAAIEGIPEVRLFDQQSMLDEFYGAFRAATLRQLAVGSLLVAVALALRYRRIRPVVAALLPSLLTAGLVLAVFGLLGVETHLIHVVSLMMVMGMGVDYGIFLVDSAGDRRRFESTLLSLVLACATTVFVFGTLALSSHGALRAMGVTTGIGVLLSLILAPIALLLAAPRDRGGP